MKTAIVLATVPVGISSKSRKTEAMKKNDREVFSDASFKLISSVNSRFVSGNPSRSIDLATVAVKIIGNEAQRKIWLDENIPEMAYKSNKNLIYAEDKNNGLYFIDLLRIDEDNTNRLKAIWLQKNRDLIEYNLTGWYTEDAHIIAHPEEIEDLYPKPNTSTAIPPTVTCIELTLLDLKTLINNQLAAKPGTITFNTDFYHNYVEFYVNAGVLAVNSYDEFTNKRHLFSMPMLRSIIKTHSLNDTSVLGIGTVTHSGATFPFLWIKGTQYFYNYSNEPR